MVSRKDSQKVQKRLRFMREQISRFMHAKYRVSVEYNLYASKELGKYGKYSTLTLPKKYGQGAIEVGIDYETLMRGSQQDLIEQARRNAIRIARWYTGYQFLESDELIQRDFEKYGVTLYGEVAEKGLVLHEYRCSACKRVWILKKKRLPKRKNPIEQNIHTICCRVEFEYAENYYTNRQLQYIKQHNNID